MYLESSTVQSYIKTNILSLSQHGLSAVKVEIIKNLEFQNRKRGEEKKRSLNSVTLVHKPFSCLCYTH